MHFFLDPNISKFVAALEWQILPADLAVAYPREKGWTNYRLLNLVEINKNGEPLSAK